MKQWMMWAFVFLVSMAGAQPKQVLVLRGDSCQYSVKHAADFYFMQQELMAPETTILVYLKQGFSWNGPDAIEYHFVVDSIRGRGDKRDALLSYSYKTRDSSMWLWTTSHEGVWSNEPSTGGRFAPLVIDTLGTTRDSTCKWSAWISYSRKMLNADYGVWYIYSDSTHPAVDWRGAWPGYPYDWQMIVRMEKILGSPTKNGGRDQRAMLKVSYFQTPSDSLYKHVVGV